MRIGFDVDGVLAASGQAMVDAFAEVLRRPLRYEDMHCFDLSEALGATEDEVCRAFDRMDRRGAWKDVPPVPGAVELLRWLVDGGHGVDVITSRPQHLSEVTGAWFRSWDFPELPIHFASDGQKARLLQDRGLDLDVFVEDHVDFARPIADGGTAVLIVDRPWNRRVQLSEGLIRCRDLVEVRRRLVEWIEGGAFL